MMVPQTISYSFDSMGTAHNYSENVSGIFGTRNWLYITATISWTGRLGNRKHWLSITSNNGEPLSSLDSIL